MFSQFGNFSPICNTSESSTLRKRFSPQEDMLIKNLALNKELSWDDIAKRLPGRTGRQCRDRYNNYLNKLVIHKEWSPEEDKIIIQKYKELGPRWAQISNFLEGRSGNNVKNRWYKYIIKRENNITTTATMPRRKKSEINSSSSNSGAEEVKTEETMFDTDFDFSFLNDEIWTNI